MRPHATSVRAFGYNSRMNVRPDIALVPLDADLDVTSVARVRDQLDRIIDGGCKRIVLNMAQASYIDSAGMGLVFREVRRMRAAGGLISITNASERVLRSLRLSRLVDFAPVSGVGARPAVQELDPSAVPLWHRVVRIDPHDLSATRSRVEELLGRVRLSPDALFDLTLAVGEAIGNAVDHSGGCDCALVALECYEDRVLVDVTDCGCGFELTDGDGTPDVSENSERGRGIRLMRLLTDSVTIERRAAGRGTRVRIVKLLGPSPADPDQAPWP